MPIILGKEIKMQENSVGVDDYSRFRILDGETIQIEFYPWPRRHPIWALEFAYEVLLWHVDMIRQHGFAEWNAKRKF